MASVKAQPNMNMTRIRPRQGIGRYCVRQKASPKEQNKGRMQNLVVAL